VIGSAGQLACRKDPVKRARYEALFASVLSKDAADPPPRTVQAAASSTPRMAPAQALEKVLDVGVCRLVA